MRQEHDKFVDALVRTLKTERAKQNISHEKLAVKSGVSRAAISKIEAGQRNPTMWTVYRLAAALHMTLEDFVKKMKLPD